MSNVINAALAAVNKSKQIAAEEKAIVLMGRIEGYDKSVATYNKFIAAEQASVKAIEEDVITVEKMLGRVPTPPLNPNQSTILEAIKKMNDARQESVKLRSQVHLNNIDRTLKTIAGIEKERELVVNELSKLEAEVMTLDQVTQ